MTNCPLCDGPVDKADLRIVDEYRLSVARMKAAETVADSLWRTTEALRDLVRRRQGRSSGDESEVAEWEGKRLAECLNVLRRAQDSFKAAGPKSI